MPQADEEKDWLLDSLALKITIVILLSVCHIMFMMVVQRIWSWIN